MQAAHQADVIHRDLKPANVLLAPIELLSNAHELADLPLTAFQSKVTDFGLAKKLEDPGRTVHGEVMGTPSYMAPEQARGDIKAIGPATDVYALGAIFYELLIGTPPFRAANRQETLDQVKNKEPVPLRTLQPKTPRDLETICLKCLQKDIPRRYATAEALADDIGIIYTASRYLPDQRPLGNGWRNGSGVSLCRRPWPALFPCCSSCFSFTNRKRRAYTRTNMTDRNVPPSCGPPLNSFSWTPGKRRHLTTGTMPRTRLKRLWPHSAHNPDLQAEELRTKLVQKLRLVQGRLQEITAHREEALARLQTFRPLYDDALFWATPSTVLDLAGSQAQTRAAAHKALSIYRLDEFSGTASSVLEQDRHHVPPDDFGRLTQRCYQLLLICVTRKFPRSPDLKERIEVLKAGANRAIQFLTSCWFAGNYSSRLADLSRPQGSLHRPEQGRGDEFHIAAQERPLYAGRSIDWFLRGLDRCPGRQVRGVTRRLHAGS